MRLRLWIERNGLPPTPIIWTTTTNNDTISQLLEKVNDAIPLESDEWALDDYAVEIGAYECLHYQRVDHIFMTDDEVRIRPLQSHELRARKVSGRHQISHAGRHLIDGVPFGKPFLRRAPDRPAVEIPPRKRRRVVCEEEEEDCSVEPFQQLVRRSDFAEEELDNVEDNADEGSYEMGSEVAEDSHSDSSSATTGTWKGLVRRVRKGEKAVSNRGSLGSGVTNEELNGMEKLPPRANPRPRRSSLRSENSIERIEKTVHFEATQEKASVVSLGGIDDEDDSSDDEDFQPESVPDGGSSDSEGDKSNDSDSDTDSDSSSGTSSSSSEDDSDSKPEEITSQPATKITPTKAKSNTLNSETSITAKVSTSTVPPGQGRLTTQKRNQRRRDAKKLKFLKATGTLGENATIADLEKWRNSGIGANHQQSRTGSSPSGEITTGEANAALEARRKHLLMAIESGGVEVGDSSSRAKTTNLNENSSLVGVREGEQETPANASQSQPRAKLDITSSRRMLFGSLGVKAPQTKKDEEKLKADFTKSADSGRRKAARTNQEGEKIWSSQAETGGIQTDVINDSWKDKISLKAVECCQEGVELSTPPFPFQQRWDPQQQGRFSKAAKRGKGKKRKRNQAQYYEQDEHYYDARDEQTYAAAEEGMELNYDDSVEVTGGDVTNGAPVEHPERCLNGKSPAAEKLIVEDDLPALPANVESLPPSTKAEMQAGAIIAFKQLTVSESWQPVILDYRTAIVKAVEEDRYIILALAKRDIVRPQKQFDETTGDRIWGKFEMPHTNEDTDPSLLELEFSDLIEPKLVRAAPAARNGDAAADSIKAMEDLQRTSTPTENAVPGKELASGANQKPVAQNNGAEAVVGEKLMNNAAIDMGHVPNPIMLQT